MTGVTLAWLIAWGVFCICVTISGVTANIIKYKLAKKALEEGRHIDVK